jgi:hypothetical protein
MADDNARGRADEEKGGQYDNIGTSGDLLHAPSPRGYLQILPN